MVVGGLPERNTVHAECVANQALDMMFYCKQVLRPDNNEPITVSVWMHPTPTACVYVLLSFSTASCANVLAWALGACLPTQHQHASWQLTLSTFWCVSFGTTTYLPLPHTIASGVVWFTMPPRSGSAGSGSGSLSWHSDELCGWAGSSRSISTSFKMNCQVKWWNLIFCRAMRQ